MRAIRMAAVLAAVLAGAAAARAAGDGAAERPNLIVILADDLGFSDLGCYGSEIQTPNLDGLAADGLRFTQFYNTARCWPTRSALVSGYYPPQIGMDPPTRKPSPSWALTLPHRLAPAGYRSYHSGKWHFHGRARPVEDAGFARSSEVGHEDNFFEPWSNAPPAAATAGFYSTAAIIDHAIDCLREHRTGHPGRPFFSYIAPFAPHFPLHAPAEDIERTRGRYDAGWDVVRARRHESLLALGIASDALPPLDTTLSPRYWKDAVLDILGPGESRFAMPWETLTPVQRRFQASKMEIHAAMVERLDREIGRLVDHLRESGKLESTLLCFLSDNGADATIIVRGGGHDPAAPRGSSASYLCLGPGWASACNSPFHRHKVWTSEGGVSTPLILHWPGGIAARGEWRHAPGHVIDLMPTFMDLAGVTARPGRGPPMPGESLVPLFAADIVPTQPRTLFFHHEGNRALREGDWKIVSAREDGGVWRLHNLRKDRGETVDLSGRHPDRLAAMAERWEAMARRFREDALSEAGQDPNADDTSSPASRGSE